MKSDFILFIIMFLIREFPQLTDRHFSSLRSLKDLTMGIKVIYTRCLHRSKFAGTIRSVKRKKTGVKLLVQKKNVNPVHYKTKTFKLSQARRKDFIVPTLSDTISKCSARTPPGKMLNFVLSLAQHEFSP